MNGYDDNRRASYFEKSKWEEQAYVGLRRSINLAKWVITLVIILQ